MIGRCRQGCWVKLLLPCLRIDWPLWLAPRFYRLPWLIPLFVLSKYVGGLLTFVQLRGPMHIAVIDIECVGTVAGASPVI